MKKAIRYFMLFLFLLSASALDSVSYVPFIVLCVCIVYGLITVWKEKLFTFQRGHYEKWSEFYE